MHGEYKNKSARIESEEMYQAAGWIGVVNVLKDFADQHKRDQLSDDARKWIGKRFLDLGAICSEDQSFFVPELERWQESRFQLGKTKLPTEIGLSRIFQPNGSINFALQSAHILGLSRDPIDQQIAKEADFARLEQSIFECHDYCMKTAQNFQNLEVDFSFIHSLLTIRNDVAFYVGLWDQLDENS